VRESVCVRGREGGREGGRECVCVLCDRVRKCEWVREREIACVCV
jgi:hypothetical protein